MADSIWWLIFAFAAGIGLFVSVLMLLRPAKLKSGTYPLVLMLTLFSVTLIEYVLFWSQYTEHFPHVTGIWKINTYCFGPLLLLFIFPEIKKKWIPLHFLPALLLLLAWIPFLILSEGEKNAWLENHAAFSSILTRKLKLYWLLTPPFLVGHQLIYLSWAGFKLRKWRKAEALKKRVFILFSIFLGAQVLYFVLLNFPFFNSEWDYMISMAMTICIFSMASLSFYQPEHFFIPQLLSPKEKYKSSPLRENQSILLAEQIKKHVESHESFLKADLRLPQLARDLNLSPQQLSQAINQGFETSFSDWINRYRIAYACGLLEKGLSAKEAGYQAGFKSMSTFYEAFKTEKGMTPKGYGKAFTKPVPRIDL
jgi:AraC-like DNA-binding protein